MPYNLKVAEHRFKPRSDKLLITSSQTLGYILNPVTASLEEMFVQETCLCVTKGTTGFPIKRHKK